MVNAQGNWTLPLGTLTDGEHSYQTKITDAAGNETRGEAVTFTVDSSAVALTIDQANDDVGSITGAVLNNGLTDDSSPELQGSATPGATVTIKDEDGSVLGTVEADAMGVWRFQLENVPDGVHTDCGNYQRGAKYRAGDHYVDDRQHAARAAGHYFTGR